jgi:hypothetical protein
VELFRLKPNRDTSSITNVSIGRKALIERLVADIGVSDFPAFPKELPRARMNLSNKAGPNGTATLNAYKDINALSKDEDLYNAVKRKLELTKPKISLDIHAKRKVKGNFNHSKLVFLPDKAGKTRLIAIGDWWSNLALTDIHIAFMQGLRKLRSDYTYRQDKIPQAVKRMGSNLYSSDMTAFTDRFPIEIEEAIVKRCYGSEVGTLWKRILQRKFPSEGGNISYEVGNPMGLLSSWAVSTSAHHLVKTWCWKVRNPNIKGYKSMILGDDSLCNNKQVHRTYLAVIRILGVSVNRNKCTSSKQGYAEFAKRLFTPEGEITGIPVDLLMGIHKDPARFIELIRIMRERGYKDHHINPGVQLVLLTFPKKVMETVLFVLSSSSKHLGMPPLVIGLGGTTIVNPPVYGGLSEEAMELHIEQAQREILWKEIDENIINVREPILTAEAPEQSQTRMLLIHPAFAELERRVNLYNNHSNTNEYSIYEAWLENKDFDLINLPSAKPYLYHFNNHRNVGAKYNILRTARAFALGHKEWSTQVPVKPTNYELFNLAFDRMLDVH